MGNSSSDWRPHRVAVAVTFAFTLACTGGPATPTPTDAPSATQTEGGTPTATPLNIEYPYERLLYVRGTINGWTGDETELEPYLLEPVDETTLYAEVVVPFGQQKFKIADNNWTLGTNFGNPPGTNDVITLGVPKIMGDNGFDLFLSVETSGIYSFTVNHTDLLRPSVVVEFVQEVEEVCDPDVSTEKARWMAEDALVWRTADADSFLAYYSPAGEIAIEEGVISGGTELSLTKTGTIDAEHPWYDDYPYLRGQDIWQVGGYDDLDAVLQSQIVVASRNEDGEVCSATGVQTYGVIDEGYAYEGDDLGVTFDEGGAPAFKLWAPTAQAVKLQRFASATDADPVETLEMTRGDAGVWALNGEAEWAYEFYLYEVTVYSPIEDELSTHTVTDPYSVSLSTDSTRSQIVDLADPTLMPEGWGALSKPDLDAPEDIVLYELHVRDFSASDATVPEADRGTFRAFTHAESNGMAHLTSLAEAGLTHVHLLPAFDIATVIEDADERAEPDVPQDAGPASEEQQAAVNAARATDAFNWGYDPFHYGVPEGSYATDPEGQQRVLEFREMVAALNGAGLRVVLDQVYNHTNAGGLVSDKSVLDKVVPGYYYRLDENGYIQGSSCCPDTATEHAMMGKLMVDMVVRWATAYKVDGFRFDLMGHHTLENMSAVRAALDALTVETHGVDGSKIYFYGEGWKFGSLDAILPEAAASQKNTYGGGYGTFNDRIRDSVRGGSPFAPLWEQGFATGMYVDDNLLDQAGSETVEDFLEDQRASALNLADNIRIGLAGNLRDFTFTGASGSEVSGADIIYRGAAGAGYTADPQENINYVSVHDNQTLWDNIQAKAPFEVDGRTPATATIDTRVRMHNLSMSLIALGQGVPLFHAGSELLRSKSGDKDSYDSGDWFNRLDFTMSANNWGVGLPIADKNQGDWDFWAPRLEAEALSVGGEEIQAAASHFEELLQIRTSSGLFRLRTAGEIEAAVSFLNAEAGAEQVPGLIVMHLDDTALEPPVDEGVDAMVVLFNANPEPVSFSHASLSGEWSKHPTQAASADSVVQGASCEVGEGGVTVPARTALVCWR